MTARPVALAVVLMLGVTSLDACRKKPEPAPTPTQAPSTVDNGAAKRAADSAAAANDAKRKADSIAAANNAVNAGAEQARVRAEVLQTLGQKVYFDYDQDSLRSDARSALDAKAAVLGANASITLVITGHTDERGTAEYNLALGQKRAAQVKRYLVSKGVGDDRLATRSMGDSQPASEGTDETSYQQNRRAEFEALSVTGTLVRPRS